MPIQDSIVIPKIEPVTVSLEPAHNAIHSLVLLTRVSKLSGLNHWIVETANAMSAKERAQNTLVTFGLHYAIAPEQSWPSFPAYIDHLASLDPVTLRDKLLRMYARFPLLSESREDLYDTPPPVDWDTVLKNTENYLEFISARFCKEAVDIDLEMLAYQYVLDPPAMQQLIISHLRSMWDTYLAQEWARVVPMLQDAVTAFQQLDLTTLSRAEAAQVITGHKLEEEKWQRAFVSKQQIVFVPSAHIGPYLSKFWTPDTLWVLFGARLPEGSKITSPDLNRAEIVMRLDALSDDTRLRILKLLSEHGELASQDIMTHLELSQSATSRHLKQLSMIGYLQERRCNGAKCYALNPEWIKETLQAVTKFLIGEK